MPETNTATYPTIPEMFSDESIRQNADIAADFILDCCKSLGFAVNSEYTPIRENLDGLENKKNQFNQRLQEAKRILDESAAKYAAADRKGDLKEREDVAAEVRKAGKTIKQINADLRKTDEDTREALSEARTIASRVGHFPEIFMNQLNKRLRNLDEETQGLWGGLAIEIRSGSERAGNVRRELKDIQIEVERLLATI